MGILMSAIASKLTSAGAALTPPAGRLRPHNADLHAQGWSLFLSMACTAVRDSNAHLQ